MNGQEAATISDLVHSDKVLLEMYRYAVGRLSSETATILADVIDDHERHEGLLESACEQADMEISEPAEDVTALMEQHLRLIRSAMDEVSMLETLSLAEHANSLLYAIAEREDLPEGLDEVVTGQHADERLHASILSSRMPQSSGLTDQHDVACMTHGLTDDRNPDDFE